MPNKFDELIASGPLETATDIRTYIGVKMIEAWPWDRDGKAGFGIKYLPSGYLSWCPKDEFESAYFPLHDGENSTISEEDVLAFLGDIEAATLGGKSTLLSVKTITGFVQHEVSSCVDPANYDLRIGAQCAFERVKKRLWPMLGFVLQWAKYGLKHSPKNQANAEEEKDCHVEPQQ